MWRHTDLLFTVDGLRQLATTTIGEDVEEAIVTLADRLREEGRIKGELRGTLQTQRKVLLKLLTLRFGALPESVSSRVNGAATDVLDTWTERVLTAATLADVLDVP